MSADRTFVTELATGLGMVGGSDDPDGSDDPEGSVDPEGVVGLDLGAALAARPAQLANLTPDDWARLDELWAAGEHGPDFEHGFANGRAFLAAPDALNGRQPRIVEWTGPRNAPGDEVVPADLRVDHVYLVSCKYRSDLLHNASPQRLVEGLLARGSLEERGDWYRAVAPAEHRELYAACRASLGEDEWAADATDLDKEQRRRLASALRGDWPAAAVEPYRRLCLAVSMATAERWSARLDARNREAVLWRLLRIGSAPYFVLGTSPTGPMRLRIDTPWDWRQRFSLRSFEVLPQPGGQPRVAWRGHYRVLDTGEDRTVEGHVELRWSHGRFGGPPEAKVYLDTPHHEVPGYHPLDPQSGRPTEPAGAGPGEGSDDGELTLFGA